MSKVKKNYSYQLFNQIVSFLSVLLITPYISRALGVDNIGIGSYITANVTYFTLIGNLGVFGYGQREVSFHRDDKRYVSQFFWEIETLHFLSYVIVSFLYLIVIFLSDKYRLYYIISYITILSSLVEINWFFQAYEEFDTIAIRNIIIKILTVICTLLFVKDQNDLPLYLAITAIGLLLANSCMWLRVKKYVEYIPFKDLEVRKHIKSVAIYFLPTIAGSVYSILDKSVINWITKSETENGYYEQGYKLLMLVNVVVQSFSTVMAPSMTYLVSKQKLKEMKEKLEMSLQFMLFISVGAAFGLIATAQNIVPVFFGDGYMPVVNILYVFAPLIIVLGFSVYLDGLYLVPVGKRRQSSYAVCVGAVSNVILNTVLVYFMKAFGAALATLLTEMIVMFIMAMLSRDAFSGKLIMKFLLKYIITGLIMSSSILIIHFLDCAILLKLILQIIVGTIVYLGALLLIKDRVVILLRDFLSSKIKKCLNIIMKRA